MTKILAVNTGSYPRVGDLKDDHRYRRALTNFEKKEISAHALNDVQHSMLQEVLLEQKSTGLDQITDGLLSWPDPITPAATAFSSIRLGGLTRFFDTNFYFRTPVITGAPKRKETPFLQEFKNAQALTDRPVRVVLTGPYTLAQHTVSTVKPYMPLKNRVRLFTDAVGADIKRLVKNGATLIQIDEPSIPAHMDDWRLIYKTIEALNLQAAPVKLQLAVYFHPLTNVFDRLITLPVDALLLDMTYDTKHLLEKIAPSKPRPALGFGLVSGRQTRIEAIDPMLNILRDWIVKTRPSTMYVHPSCGLEYLPRPVALQKLKLVVRLRDELQTWASIQGPTAHG